METKTTQATDSSRYGNLTIIPASDALGAEIRGVDLANVDNDTYRLIRNALIDNLVVLIRDQNISDAELVARARRESRQGVLR